MTDFPVSAIVSVELTSPDLPRHAAFYRDIWGLDTVGQTAEAAYFAGTGADPYCLGLFAGAAPALRAVTFRCADAASMAACATQANAAGCEVRAAAGNRPGGGESVEIREPRGCVIRLVHGDTLRAAAPPAPGRPVGLAHVNLNTRDVDALAAFYSDVLGFRLSDRSKPMAFLRCNSSHNDVVLADAPGEGLNHIAFLLPEWEDVMRASGRMIDHGYPIGWGVGRHGPGDNVFAYFVDPFGYVVEHTAEVLEVDDSYRVGGPQDWTWPPGRTDQWGIAPPKTDACKAAQIAVGFAPI